MTFNLEIKSESLKGLLKTAEGTIYEMALLHCQYNQTLAARLLCVSRGTFRGKLKEHFGNKYIIDKRSK